MGREIGVRRSEVRRIHRHHLVHQRHGLDSVALVRTADREIADDRCGRRAPAEANVLEHCNGGARGRIGALEVVRAQLGVDDADQRVGQRRMTIAVDVAEHLESLAGQRVRTAIVALVAIHVGEIEETRGHQRVAGAVEPPPDRQRALDHRRGRVELPLVTIQYAEVLIALGGLLGRRTGAREPLGERGAHQRVGVLDPSEAEVDRPDGALDGRGDERVANLALVHLLDACLERFGHCRLPRAALPWIGRLQHVLEESADRLRLGRPHRGPVPLAHDPGEHTISATRGRRHQSRRADGAG